MVEKKTYISKTYRFPKEMVDAIERRAAYHGMKKSEYMKYLVMQECASDYTTGQIMKCRLDNLSDKMDMMKLLMDEFGNLFLEFITVVFASTNLPDIQKLVEKMEKEDNNLNKILEVHKNKFKMGQKDFLRTIFGNIIEEDEDICRDELKCRVIDQMKESIRASVMKEE